MAMSQSLPISRYQFRIDPPTTTDIPLVLVFCSLADTGVGLAQGKGVSAECIDNNRLTCGAVTGTNSCKIFPSARSSREVLRGTLV